MFIRTKTLKKWLGELLGQKTEGIEGLLREAKELIGPAGDVSKLKREIAELELQKTMSEREIKHLVKLKEEKLIIEHEKKAVELQKGYQVKEMEMRTEYHDKVLKSLEDFQCRQDKFFGQIMERLPNVDVLLNNDKG